jgi:hypothetical protein
MVDALAKGYIAVSQSFAPLSHSIRAWHDTCFSRVVFVLPSGKDGRMVYAAQPPRCQLWPKRRTQETRRAKRNDGDDLWVMLASAHSSRARLWYVYVHLCSVLFMTITHFYMRSYDVCAPCGVLFYSANCRGVDPHLPAHSLARHMNPRGHVQYQTTHVENFSRLPIACFPQDTEAMQSAPLA